MSDQLFLSKTPTPPATAALFPDLHPGFDRQAAVPEANRCLFCFDAPCMQACPTHIDVPRFIKKIANDNLPGSAATILEANVMGASCSRACPVEVLCEGACVLHRYNKQPIEIGRLQRYAMDAFHAPGTNLPFVPAPDTGKKVALIGAGPASLACAAELRRAGHAATIYDARPLPGGLNTYGIAEYKLSLKESLREIDMIARLGVEFKFGVTVDAAKLAELEKSHDAVFLGMGLGAIHRLGVPGEELKGVTNALDLVAGYKDGTVTSVPEAVAVIGAGNTAIDAAIAAKRLGAAEVHILYRRTEPHISAFDFEYEHAKQEGVRFHWLTQPIAVHAVGASLQSLECVAMQIDKSGALQQSTAATFHLPCDLVIPAIGQSPLTELLARIVTVEKGRIVIDRATGKTSNPKFFAGGDCTNGGREVVDAVADGKRAALAMAARFEVAYA